MPKPPEAPTPPLVTRFTLRPLEDQITVGPQNGVRNGVIRVLSGCVQQDFEFRNGQLIAGGRIYDFSSSANGEQFQVPSKSIVIPGAAIYCNVLDGWLRVERREPGVCPIEVRVDFPGDRPLRSVPYRRWY